MVLGVGPLVLIGGVGARLGCYLTAPHPPRGLSAHDSRNLFSMCSICDLAESEVSRVPCIVMFQSRKLLAMLR